MINREELKSKARMQVKENILTYFGILVVSCFLICVSSFVIIGPFVLPGAIMLGIAKFDLDVARGKKGEFDTLFAGFKQFGSSFVAFILEMIFILLWSTLLLFPGIIAALRYSMTFYILADNPEISGIDALKKSKAMMVGHKTELFVLLLSFFMWYILSAITFGIAAIYVSPYTKLTIANFYEQIKIEQAS